MSDEKIVIEIENKIDVIISRRLTEIGNGAENAARGIEKLTSAQTRSAVNAEKIAQAEIKTATALQTLAAATIRAQTEQEKLNQLRTKGITASDKLAQSEKKNSNDIARRNLDMNNKIQRQHALTNAKIIQDKFLTHSKMINAERLTTSKIIEEIKRTEAARIKSSTRSRGIPSVASSSASSVGSSIGGMAKAAIGAVAGYLTIQEIADLGNAYVGLQNKLKVVTESQAQLTDATGQMFAISNRTRTPIEDNVKAFSRFDMALKPLGKSQQEVLDMTETISKALVISGATASESGQGLLQLSQAFNKGKLDGDEFRSVMELMPVVADAIAKELKVTRGELLLLAPQGKITAEVMSKALASAAIEIDAKFGKTLPTIGQAMDVLRNNAVQFFGTIQENTGVLSDFAGFIQGFSNALPQLSGNVSTLTTSVGYLAVELSSIGPKSSTSIGILQRVLNGLSLAIAAVADTVRVLKYAFMQMAAGVAENMADVFTMMAQVAEVTNVFSPIKIPKESIDSIKYMAQGLKNFSIESRVASELMLVQETNFDKTRKEIDKNNAATQKLLQTQEKVNALNEQMQPIAEKYLAIKESVDKLTAAKKRSAAQDIQLKNEQTELIKLDKLYKSLKEKRNAAQGNLNLRETGPNLQPNKGKSEKELEKERLKQLAFDAGVKIKHPEKFKHESDLGLPETKQEIAIRKLNQAFQEESIALQQVGNAHEIYSRVNQTFNSLLEHGIFLTKQEIEALALKYQSQLKDKEINQARNTIYSETTGRINSMNAQVVALGMSYRNQTINLDYYTNSLVKLKVADSDLALQMQKGTNVDIAISALGRLTSAYKGVAAGMADVFGNMFTTIADGFADSIGKAVVEGKSLNDSLNDIAKNGLSALISGFVKLGIQYVTNSAMAGTATLGMTTASLAAAGTMAAAWAPAATLVSLATMGANSIPATEGMMMAELVGQMMAVPGFKDGGYTGSMGTSDVAGLVHGQEFVVNAGATAKNRPMLEAMNRGSSVGNNSQVSISIENYGTSKDFEIQKSDNNEIRIIARDEANKAIRASVPSLVASEVANPNSQVSKSLGQNTQTGRRR